MQIVYLVGVGLLLNFDLLACTHSQGVLYCSAKVCIELYTAEG